MNLKDIEFWIELYDGFKDTGFIILFPILYAIIKLLNQNKLYQREKSEKIKTFLNNTLSFIFITIVAFAYLSIMVLYSLSAHPQEEVTKYVTNWDNIGSFIILLIMYSMLFPIVILPFLGKRRSKRYFVEIVEGYIIKREVIDRITINNKDKLILRDEVGFQTEKDITDFKNLKFETPYKKSWLTIEDIKMAMLRLKGKHISLKILICVIAFGVPTGYLIWTLVGAINDLNDIQQWQDIFMYIGIFTLPVILIGELYCVAWVIYRSLFKKK